MLLDVECARILLLACVKMELAGLVRSSNEWLWTGRCHEERIMPHPVPIQMRLRPFFIILRYDSQDA